MATCYLCGHQIPPDEPQFRRRVRTGDRTRISYRTGKTLDGITTYGRRLVCARCARLLDKQSSIIELRRHLLTVFLALLAFLVILVK